ncbi:DJ-1/PfpI family protein [Paenibacillus chartarius]|uniref:DJ-1/PfpI family protein n=1 Tax=Paenibacillus chartarius TaxID=747481 RepID=A0ABV6DS86_9BACL
MKMAFVLFDGLTTLDVVGFYDAVTRLRVIDPDTNVSWDFCALTEWVTDDRGLTMKANRIQPNLGEYDLVFVPGGFATRQLRFDDRFIGWLRTAENAPLLVSVCTGALLLGACGFLAGKTATTNPSAYDLLLPYCRVLAKKRIVKDGAVITAGGVAASIDLGLAVAEHLTDTDTALKVQTLMDYPYYRPGLMFTAV